MSKSSREEFSSPSNVDKGTATFDQRMKQSFTATEVAALVTEKIKDARKGFVEELTAQQMHCKG
jgi:hypothetical protein